jgi:site-specific DNA recombinase
MTKHAAILIRVSTPDQKKHGTSLPQQKSDLPRLAKSLGYVVIKKHIYDDGGYSGSQLSHSQRPGLGELIKAAERKEFEVVFVQYVDRFGRTTLENLITRDKMKKLGIVIHSYFEGRMENDPAGDLLFMFHSWKAEADNEQRKERSIRGRIAATRNGKHCMGNPSYGYKRDPRGKNLAVIKTLAGWVRKFYQWCAIDRLSLREICRRANQLQVPLPGYKRRKHSVWHRSVIHRMLTNPAYTGKIIFRRYDKSGNERPKEEWVELSVPPIVSQKLFEKVQTRLRENKQIASRNTKRTYLYSGVIFCGYCQHRLGSGFQPARHQGRGTRYYHGLARKTEIGVGLCSHCPQVAEGRLEPVWEAVKNALTDPEYLRGKVTEYLSSDTQVIDRRLAELGQQISTVTHQRKKFLGVYLKDPNLDEKEYLRLVNGLDYELHQLTEEKRVVEQRLLNDREQLALSVQISQTYDQIRSQVVGSSYETRREIIKKVVNKIIVYERQSEAEIEFHLAPARNQLAMPCFPEHGDDSESALDPAFASRRSSTTGHKFEWPGIRIKVPILPARKLANSGSPLIDQRLAA